MNEVDLAHADLLHSVASTAEVRQVGVGHPLLRSLSRDIGRLHRGLRDERDDPYWQEVLRYMRTFMFAVAGTPLPFNDPSIGLGSLVDRLLDQVVNIESAFPDFAAHVRTVIDEMIAIGRSAEDPLGDAVRADLKGSRGSHILLLLRRVRRVPAVREHLVGSLGPRLQIGTSHLLSSEDVYDRIVAIGPSRWFPEALAAPRARRIDLFCYSWVRDQPPPIALFMGSRRGSRLRADLVEAAECGGEDELPESFFEPRVAWSEIRDKVLRAVRGDEEETEEIEARLFLLADSSAVYVEAEEGARSYVLDPRAEIDDRVQLLPADDLAGGMFLILRTEGGDERTALADRILGDHAAELRQRQRMWKERLRNHIRTAGAIETVRQLRDRGSARANASNLRNWAATRSKRTRDYEDFLAIMRLTDLESEAPRLWEEMGIIVSAHQQAGQQVRAVLIRRMEKADLTRLKAEGRLDFDASDLGGGTLTAFRIEEVSPDTQLIPEHRVDHPFRLEDELWQG